MDDRELQALIEAVRDGTTAPDEAVRQLRRLPFADLGFAKVDHHRTVRQHRAEVVFGPGKTPEQCVAIIGELLAASAATPVLLTRASDDAAAAVLAAHAGGTRRGSVIVWRPAPPDRAERVAVVTAGTGDLPVAIECVAVLEAHGLAPTSSAS